MYWFRPAALKHFILAGILISAVAACRPDSKEKSGELKYFDIKGYFKADSARLTRNHKPVTKTIMHNGAAETKKLYIDNWGHEFELFTNSDINKPAWRDSYTMQSANGLVIYHAKSDDLKTSEIIIKKDGGKVKWILIFNHTKNMLYENSEKLSYFPDSAYMIVKVQKVRLLGKNTYVIKGKFN